MIVHTITHRTWTSKRHEIQMSEAYAGHGLNEMKAIAANPWDAIGFLVELLLKTPGVTLANSVDLIQISEH